MEDAPRHSPRAEACGWAIATAIIGQTHFDLSVGTQVEVMAAAALAGYLWRWWRG